jgi:hypothetical protein
VSLLYREDGQPTTFHQIGVEILFWLMVSLAVLSFVSLGLVAFLADNNWRKVNALWITSWETVIFAVIARHFFKKIHRNEAAEVSDEGQEDEHPGDRGSSVHHHPRRG